jgi:hypothetical protein
MSLCQFAVRGTRRRDLALACFLASVFLGACGSSGSSAAVDAGDAGKVSRSDAGTDALAEASRDSEGAPDAVGSARANGTLGDWQSLPPMPLPRANHCAVAAAGYLVVIGGNYEPSGGSSFVNIDLVHVAPLHSDGSIGAWAEAGTTPSAVNGCTAAAKGSTIYLVDGIYDDTGDQGHSFSAELSTEGKLGAWTALGPLPDKQDTFYSYAWVGADQASTLYAIDSNASATEVLRVATAPSFGAWSTETWLSGFLGRPEYAFTGSYLYAMGGYLSTDAGNPSVKGVQGASVGADGKLGTPFTTTALPMAITYGNGVSVDDWIFVVGGKSSPFGSGEVNAMSAKVGPLGKLGPWQTATALPEGRTDMALTLWGDFLYLTGGGDTGPGVATVFAARVRL